MRLENQYSFYHQDSRRPGQRSITNTYTVYLNICNNLLINCSGTKSVAELMLYKLWTFIFEFLINFHPPTPPPKNPLPQMFGKFIASVCAFIRMSANLRHLNLNVCIVGKRGKLGTVRSYSIEGQLFTRTKKPPLANLHNSRFWLKGVCHEIFDLYSFPWFDPT